MYGLMAELCYHVASTLDGYIAHPDGSFDGFEWDDEVVKDFLADIERFGTVLMGRKTYDVGLKEGKTSPYPALRQILFSRTMEESPDEAVELVRDDIVEFVRDLKRRADRPIWLCGGSEIATTLLAADLVDRVVVKLNPVVFGSGIPLLSVLEKHLALELEELRRYECGIVLLEYRVRRESSTRS